MQIQPLPWLMNRDDLSVAVHFSSCAINWVVLSKLSGGGKWYLIPAITPARLLFLCAGWSSRRNAADDQRGEPSSSKGYAPTPFVGVFSFWPAGVRRRKKKKKKQLIPWIKHKRGNNSCRRRLWEREGWTQVGAFTFSVKDHQRDIIRGDLHNQG